LSDDTMWKLSGYEMMKAVEKFAKKHPETRFISCDDGVNSSSNILLVPHRAGKKYHGTTVVYIPQNQPCNPSVLFLYPNHKRALINALKEMK